MFLSGNKGIEIGLTVMKPNIVFNDLRITIVYGQDWYVGLVFVTEEK